MVELLQSRRFRALLSAGFAGVEAILVKVGVSGMDANIVTCVRTVVIPALAGAIVIAAGQVRVQMRIPGRSALSLVLTDLATGTSRLCCGRALSPGDAARVAPVDRFSVVLVAGLLGKKLSGANGSGGRPIAADASLVAFR